MRVDLEHDVARNAVKVFATINGDRILRFLPDGMMRWDALRPEVGDVEPTLILPGDLAAALGPALLEVLPPSREQATALQDTREVRDRLLTLVEAQVNAINGGAR